MRQNSDLNSVRPSARWTSYGTWDYNGMKERLEQAIAGLDKSALIRHAELLIKKPLTMSEPFSAGQHWICFEMVAEDGDLVLARVRLPRHPDTPVTVTEEDEQYAIECEIATMRFVKQKLPMVKVPEVYAYAEPGSEHATKAGAAYMLLEGFYGNTLPDVEFDMCQLPVKDQVHIITQWTNVQAELATLVYPAIGSTASLSETGEPVIGRLAMGPYEGLVANGPFSNATEYWKAIAQAGLGEATRTSTEGQGSMRHLNALVFSDIVANTELFKSDDKYFPFNHMDLGTQNILVDDSFNFLAIIDWEYAQTAPWEASHFPFPFPLLASDEKIQEALKDPSSLAHKNTVKQSTARQMYITKFQEAEAELRNQGRGLKSSHSEVLASAASRVYGCYTRIDSVSDGGESLIREMVRLAFEFDGDDTTSYLKRFGYRSTEATTGAPIPEPGCERKM